MQNRDMEIDRLTVENVQLRAARDELAYVVNYFQGGIRPLDLNDWWRRACAALAATQRKGGS